MSSPTTELLVRIARNRKDVDPDGANRRQEMRDDFAAIDNDSSLTDHERLLFRLRAEEEGRHRRRQRRNVCIPWMHLQVPNTPSEPGFQFTLDEIRQSFNKTCAIYTTVRALGFRHHMDVFIHALWFRPYVTPISYDRYFCKVFQFHEQWQSFDRGVITSAHLYICEQMQRYAAKIAANNHGDTKLHPEIPRVRQGPEIQFEASNKPSEGRWTRTSIIHPIFRAIYIVFSDHLKAPGVVPDNAGEFVDSKVAMVLTGETAGLSAPISFKNLPGYSSESPSILVTSFWKACAFVLSIERREFAAFGLQPYSTNNTDALLVEKLLPPMERLNTVRTKRGLRPFDLNPTAITGPTHTWVDPKKFPKWIGQGAISTEWMQAENEKLDKNSRAGYR